MSTNSTYRFFIFLLITFLITSCGSTPIEATEPPALDSSSNTPLAPTATPESRALADPQRIEFEAEDGQKLIGYYYPASVEPAPVLVLMHWTGGTNCDWVAVNLVQWAQNRGLPEGIAANPACENAQLRLPNSLVDFPPLPEGQSYAVFAFDYRGYGESVGSPSRNPTGRLKDSIAAMQAAQKLDGVDPERIVTIGASIGADGAIDACGEGCLGALSLSPGNYLGLPYIKEVAELDTEGKPTWCVASKSDFESFPICKSTNGENFQKIIYETKGHGMELFGDTHDPKITQVIFDFLQTIFSK